MSEYDDDDAGIDSVPFCLTLHTLIFSLPFHKYFLPAAATLDLNTGLRIGALTV